MYTLRKRYNNKNHIITLIIFLSLVSVFFLSIGYSAFQYNMEVSDTFVNVRFQKDIRITDILLNSVENEATSNWEEYNIKNISSNIDLPNQNSSITYKVEITNIGNVEMGIFDIKGLPSNLKYDISSENYNLKDPICDDNNPSSCKLGIVKNIYIKIEYAENGYDSLNTTYLLDLEFDFRRMFSITYIGFNNVDSLSKKVIEGETKTISFNNTSSIPFDVLIDGASYNYTSPSLSLYDVKEDVLIYKKYAITYVLDGGIQADGQVTSISSVESIPLLEPEKEGYAFRGWYDNNTFDGDPIDTLSDINDDITLYAYFVEYDYFVKNAEFDGTVDTVKNTEIMLYSAENVNRNFRLKFKIESFDPMYYDPNNVGDKSNSQTIASSMLETASPYSGFTFRLAKTGTPLESKFSIKINDSHVSSYTGYYDLEEGIDVEIIREDGKIYTKVDSDTYTMVLNYNGNIDSFDVPLTIGGNINQSGNYDRFFKGKLTDISIEFYEGSLIYKNLSYRETKTAKSYTLDGSIMFDGSNYIDTGLNLFSPENINKDFDISLTLDQIGANTTQATLINFKDESQKDVWPGVSYRLKNNKSTIEFTGRWPGEAAVSIEDKTSPPKTIKISRKNGVIYYSVNDNAEKKLISVPPASLNKAIDVNLTFGSSLDSSKKPFRYFNGIVSNISVKLHDES